MQYEFTAKCSTESVYRRLNRRQLSLEKRRLAPGKVLLHWLAQKYYLAAGPLGRAVELRYVKDCALKEHCALRQKNTSLQADGLGGAAAGAIGRWKPAETERAR